MQRPIRKISVPQNPDIQNMAKVKKGFDKKQEALFSTLSAISLSASHVLYSHAQNFELGILCQCDIECKLIAIFDNYKVLRRDFVYKVYR